MIQYHLINYYYTSFYNYLWYGAIKYQSESYCIIFPRNMSEVNKYLYGWIFLTKTNSMLYTETTIQEIFLINTFWKFRFYLFGFFLFLFFWICNGCLVERLFRFYLFGFFFNLFEFARGAWWKGFQSVIIHKTQVVFKTR